MNPLTNEIKQCLAYIFDKYADMEPVISGMIGVYLDGFDIGRFTSDVDIMFMSRESFIPNEKVAMRLDVEKKFPVCLDVMASKLEEDDVISEADIDGKTYRHFTAETIFKYKRRLAENGHGVEKHMADIEEYERQKAERAEGI